MGSLLAWATRGGTLRDIQHVTPVPPGSAQGLVAEVYDQVERDFGMLAPPISLHSPAPQCLAAVWSMLRESLLASGVTTRGSREAVAVAVSAGNSCPYCVDVHSATLTGLTGAQAVADQDAAPDPRFDALGAWARASATNSPLSAPFPATHAPELIGVAVTFHYLNRMVNIFLPPSPIPPVVRGVARRAAGRVAARVLGSLARRPVRPGRSSGLLPTAPLPADLFWAAGHDGVATAFAAAVHAVEAAGERAVPEAVRALAVARQDDPAGNRPGLDARDWLEGAVAPLAEADRPAGRLVMLTMFASYRVTPQLLAQVRLRQPGDDTLIQLTSWASLLAARRIGARLGVRDGRTGRHAGTGDLA
ncbi:AhpD family alkylhydroperoxidase [Micromonospora pisi]|uniref:AhpD family alkylhydroperoxidase n=1 Tax=Micromonospora pisi TaxID=589240 RepID=A0A495JDA3_9ACTN|nr:carboxymuconolactone decarboxylase family protein [Micromonospora pisi]RKR86897.1 AhpD family alkylhydroperoxidase [Micromonospora pisi]